MTPTDLRLLQHVMCRNVIGVHFLIESSDKSEGAAGLPDVYDIDRLPDVPLKGRCFWHMATSYWEAATLAFFKFGFCEPKTPGAADMPSGRFIVDFQDIPSCVENTVRASAPSLRLEDYLDDNVMCAYLWTAQDPSWAFPTKTGPAFPISNEAFDCPDVWKTDLELFTACGYAMKAGAQYKWSPKMAQIMMDVYLWDREGNPM